MCLVIILDWYSDVFGMEGTDEFRNIQLYSFDAIVY